MVELGKWLSTPSEGKNEDERSDMNERKDDLVHFEVDYMVEARCERNGEKKTINVFYNETTATTINST